MFEVMVVSFFASCIVFINFMLLDAKDTSAVALLMGFVYAFGVTALGVWLILRAFMLGGAESQVETARALYFIAGLVAIECGRRVWRPQTSR